MGLKSIHSKVVDPWSRPVLSQFLFSLLTFPKAHFRNVKLVFSTASVLVVIAVLAAILVPPIIPSGMIPTIPCHIFITLVLYVILSTSIIPIKPSNPPHPPAPSHP